MRLRFAFLVAMLVFIIGCIFFYVINKTVIHPLQETYEEFNRKIQEELYTFP